MHGLYLLWWVEEKKRSPASVGAVLAAGGLALLFLEVPTGWFADRVGHRASLIAGSSIQIVGLTWCWLGEGFAGLVVASVLVPLGDAFRSGADAALLYRTCRALDCEQEFQAIEARATAVELCALVGLVLAGGFIVSTWGYAAGWIVEILLSAVGVAIACALIEPSGAVECNWEAEQVSSARLLSMTVGLVDPTEADPSLMVLVVLQFLDVSNLLILIVLALEHSFACGLHPGLRQFNAAERETGEQPFQTLAVTLRTGSGGGGGYLQEFELMPA